MTALRVGDAWLVGVGKRAPHGLRCPCLVSPHGSLDRLFGWSLLMARWLGSKLICNISLNRMLKDRRDRARQGGAR